jgi:hypothetical protein
MRLYLAARHVRPVSSVFIVELSSLFTISMPLLNNDSAMSNKTPAFPAESINLARKVSPLYYYYYYIRGHYAVRAVNNM